MKWVTSLDTDSHDHWLAMEGKRATAVQDELGLGAELVEGRWSCSR